MLGAVFLLASLGCDTAYDAAEESAAIGFSARGSTTASRRPEPASRRRDDRDGQASRGARPDAGAAGQGAARKGNPWARCYDGFRPGTDTPQAGAMRLSLLCGPSTGMRRLPPDLEGRVDTEGPESSHAVRLESTHCYRLFAAAPRSVEDLELELRGPSGEVVDLVNRGGPWAVLPAQGPLCIEDGGRHVLSVRTHGGHGEYVVQLWRFKR